MLVFYKKLGYAVADHWTLRMVLKSRSLRAFVQLIRKLAESRQVVVILDDFQRASVGACLVCRVLTSLAKLPRVSLVLAAERGLEEAHEALLLDAGFRVQDWALPRLEVWQEYLRGAGVAVSEDELRELGERVRLNWFWVNEFVHRESSFQFLDELGLQNARSMKEYYRDSRAVLDLLRSVEQEGRNLTFPALADKVGVRVLGLKNSELLAWEAGRATVRRARG